MVKTTPPASRPLEGYVEIHVGSITPNPNNPRKTIDDLDDLAASIQEHGLLQPLVVEETTPGAYRIIAGHRRYAALLRLARMWAPCIVHDPTADLTDQLVLALVENGQRRNLDPIAEAKVLRHLRDTTDLTVKELGTLVGRSQTWVSHRLQLLNLSAKEQLALASGDSTIRDLQPAARAKSPTAQPDRPEYATSRPHFTINHPLNKAAVKACTKAGHPQRGAIHGGACQVCWEATIRADERSQ